MGKEEGFPVKKPHVQQKTERRISAALRLGLVAVLLLAQIALVLFLSDLLRQRMAMAYTVLELLALAYAFRINSRPGGSSYKLGWTLLILTVPVVGLICWRCRWAWSALAPFPLSAFQRHGWRWRCSIRAGFGHLPEGSDSPPNGSEKQV